MKSYNFLIKNRKNKTIRPITVKAINKKQAELRAAIRVSEKADIEKSCYLVLWQTTN